jgi:hypothetical protein
MPAQEHMRFRDAIRQKRFDVFAALWRTGMPYHLGLNLQEGSTLRGFMAILLADACVLGDKAEAALVLQYGARPDHPVFHAQLRAFRATDPASFAIAKATLYEVLVGPETIEENDHDVVYAMLDLSLDVPYLSDKQAARFGIFITNAFFNACMQRKVRLAAQYIRHGVDINVSDERGYTAEDYLAPIKTYVDAELKTMMKFKPYDAYV